MTGNLILSSPATLALQSLTSGSVLFIGASGVVSQNNTGIYWDDALGTLVFPNGTTAIGQSNAVIRGVSNSTSLVNYFEVYNSSKATATGVFAFRRGRGTFASQSFANSGDALGSMVMQANIGSNTWGYAAKIIAEADNTVSGTSSPGRLRILTQPVGTTAETALIEAVRWDSSQNQSNVGKIIQYGNVAAAGWGVPAIYAEARSTAQTAAVASVATYTVPATDGSFLVSANILVTTSSVHSFTATVAYTDEGNTSRTLTLQFSSLAGAFVTAIANAAGAVPYEGVPLHIRCKASTTITIATTGTFTSVTYNVEGMIAQIA